MKISILLPCLVMFSVFFGCGDDGPSPQPPGVPESPASVRAEAEGLAIRVQWVDRSDDDRGFVVFRVEGEATFDDAPAVARVAATSSTFVDESVERGVAYRYAVAAENEFGRSALSEQLGDAVAVTIVRTGCENLEATDADPDGDGILTEDEIDGWIVRINEDGMDAESRRLAVSDPTLADTDGDGLCDGAEQTLRTDPRRSDTDGDGLTDLEEVERWGSSPTNVDSDGDGGGNSAFFDGSEVERFGTSPALADSDGDGRSDFVEINQNSTNPLLADIPRPRLRFVGELDLGVNVVLQSGEEVMNAVSTSLAREATQTDTETSTVATTESISRSMTIGSEASAGLPLTVGVGVSGELTQAQGFVGEESASWTNETSTAVQNAFEEISGRIATENQTITDGTLAMQLSVQNAGTRTFAMRDVVVTALRRDLRRGTFTSVATLALPDAANDLVLGEGQTAGPFRVESTIAANSALDLLANPAGLLFRVASFNLEDRTGENFEFSVGETTASRTALLTIDFGGERPLESYRVATNIERTAGGGSAGVRLADVMENVLGLALGEGYETLETEEGVAVLNGIRGVRSEESGERAARFWVVIGGTEQSLPSSQPIERRVLDPNVPFGDKRLLPRDQVFLAYVSDRDGDGLFTREENLYRTSDDDPDSDGDGLTDFEEVRDGWRVGARLPLYEESNQVFSNPLFADLDGDGLTDAEERDAMTDPNRADTDQDTLDDGVDNFPLTPPRSPSAHVYGTTGDESLMRLVGRDEGGVYMLGLSTGDIDEDGESQGFFLMATDEDGAVEWVQQFEGFSQNPRPLSFSNTFDIASDGRVVWAADFEADPPLFESEGPHFVLIDDAGNVETVPMDLEFPRSFNGPDRLVVFGDVGQVFEDVAGSSSRLRRFRLSDGMEVGPSFTAGFGVLDTTQAAVGRGLDGQAVVAWRTCGLRTFDPDGNARDPFGCPVRANPGFPDQAMPLWRAAITPAGVVYGMIHFGVQATNYLNSSGQNWEIVQYSTSGDQRVVFSQRSAPPMTADIYADAFNNVFYSLGAEYVRADNRTFEERATRTVAFDTGSGSIRALGSNDIGDSFVGGQFAGELADAPPSIGGRDIFVIRNIERAIPR
ncbi:MAG: hypothetical protein AAF645_11140 [Myxococcota bacterium]